MAWSADRISRITLIASFAIWVVYGVLVGMRHWTMAVTFGLVASLCLLAVEANLPIKIKLMDWTVLSYFVLASLATFLVRSTAFPVYSSIVIWFLYAGVTWTSMLSGTPFTMQYARESTPPEHWHSPEFVRSNRIITVAWGIGFTVNIALVTVALNPRNHPLLSGVLAPLVIMGSASIFTSRYARIVHERAQLAARAQGA